MNNHVTKGSVFNDLGFNEAEAENLKIRAALMRVIEKYIEDNKLTQATAAKLMGVYQPRISDLLQGKIDKFTIDMLVNMLAKAHVSVSLVVDDRIAA
ncbi:MAG: helix-turn-helix transcriptional regulator [Legionellaceae bacterium]|nr:helix-turn-helix transcriptional regulator [Legionellaceae bacterium]